jgi:hypothetical protein
MPEFTFKVIETITQAKEYVVEADSLEEAKDKACLGDTVEVCEELLKQGSVSSHRNVAVHLFVVNIKEKGACSF